MHLLVVADASSQPGNYRRERLPMVVHLSEEP